VGSRRTLGSAATTATYGGQTLPLVHQPLAGRNAGRLHLTGTASGTSTRSQARRTRLDAPLTMQPLPPTALRAAARRSLCSRNLWTRCGQRAMIDCSVVARLLGTSLWRRSTCGPARRPVPAPGIRQSCS